MICKRSCASITIPCVFLRTVRLNQILKSKYPARSNRRRGRPGDSWLSWLENYIYIDRQWALCNSSQLQECRWNERENRTRRSAAAPRPSITGLTLIIVKYISVECAKGAVLKANKCVPKTPSEFVQQQL